MGAGEASDKDPEPKPVTAKIRMGFARGENVAAEAAKAVEAATPETVEAEVVSEPPYARGESVVDAANEGMFNQYGNMGQTGYGGQTDDPWASGGDSMFFQ